MRRLLRVALIAGLAAATALGLANLAQALWMSTGTMTAPPIAIGTVGLDAYGQSGVTTPQYSTGGPVTLVLPGADIAGVLDQTGINAPPIIWRFTIEGFAKGIAGLNIDVTVDSQVERDGTTTDLSSGKASTQSLLGFSTLRVYPASVNGDCSVLPDVPVVPDKNVYVVDNTDHVLQAPGAFGGSPTTQIWCAALDFNNEPDATYSNEVQALATASDQTEHSAIATWNAVVAFPPALDPIGTYVNRADVAGIAEDGTTSRDSDTYQATLYPDPANEPDVKIVIKPDVTSLA